MKVSASSINKVGSQASMDRNSAADEILDAARGRLTMRLKRKSIWLLPHLFSGAVMTAMGATWITSINHVITAHNVAAVTVSFWQTIKRLIVFEISVRSSAG